MEQTDPHPDDVKQAKASATWATNELVTPQRRLRAIMASLELKDDATAALLGCSRPVVTRTRLGDRSPSFDVAARIETVFGIPASHWCELPAMVKRNGAMVREQTRKARRAGHGLKVARA